MVDTIKGGWRWVPTAFFAEGAPFMVISAVSAILFKSIGMDNARMAFWTSLLMLPWTVKPLWAPLLDHFATKRFWIIICQGAMAVLAGIAALLLGMTPLTGVLFMVFFLLAMASATHDTAADGFYMIALDSHGQSFFSGIRSTAYRTAAVCVQGGLVALAGMMEHSGISIRGSWAITLGISAVVMAGLTLWHTWNLPKAELAPSAGSAKRASLAEVFRAFPESWGAFFRQEGVWRLLIFLFFFRIAEAQLGKIAGVFLIDAPEKGGLGLPLAQQGFLYGTVGVIALTLGGILGGVIVAKKGFHACVWWLALAINLPDAVYVYLAAAKPASLWCIGGCIAVEQFGYGLGYTVFLMVMLAAAGKIGRFRTSHFALMTAAAMLSLTFFGMLSGIVQEKLGYLGFFWYVLGMTLPSYGVLALILWDIPREFGRAVPEK